MYVSSLSALTANLSPKPLFVTRWVNSINIHTNTNTNDNNTSSNNRRNN